MLFPVIDLSLVIMVLSPLRNLIAVSQPGILKVMVWGFTGGRECPNSVVMALADILRPFRIIYWVPRAV